MTKKMITLVVFDLAGTVVDFGSRAPAGAFCELFRRHGVFASEDEARVPMGMHKRDHIKEMLGMPSIASQWRRKHRREWSSVDVDSLFEEFIPLQLEALPRFADAIPGAAKAIDALRTMGIKVAATTGYNRPMTTLLVDILAKRGISFDFTCSAAEVSAGRPRPWMIYHCMEALDVFPPSSVVNIGDTLSDVRAGVNAGVWSAGVTVTGNMFGMSMEQAGALPTDKIASMHKTALETMLSTGADLVMESVAALPQMIEVVEDNLMEDVLPGLRAIRRTEPTLNKILEKAPSMAAGISLR
jgi:phosphonoacetaldehyde hydrolase